MIEVIVYSTIAIVILCIYWWNENKWRIFTPTNNKKWRKNQKVLQTVTFNDDETVTIHNLRDTLYKSFIDYIPRHSDVILKPDEIVSARIYTSKLTIPGVHLFTSFTFKDGHKIVISIQMRRYGDTYGILHALRMFINPSELIYLIMTQRDALMVNDTLWNKGLHTYKINLETKELSKLFIDAIKRADRLATHPEFYSLFSNNCITNILDHVNKTTHIKLPSMHWTYFATQHLGKLLKKKGLVS